MSETMTSAVQDYLKAIHQLGGATDGVSTSAVAERLGVSAASVSGMLKRLDEQGLVSHKRYQGVRLTKKGTRQAVEMIRHHRLLELYLVKVVGMPLDRVHDEADALEHVISEELESRLDELLGYPTEDPHGHPIPSANLELTESQFPTLAVAGAGAHCIVRRISDRDPEMLRYLDGLGVRPGVELVVEDVIAYSGGVRVRIAGAEQLIGLEAAAAIEVSIERGDDEEDR